MTDKTKCYSLDDETFNHDSFGELLDDLASDGELTPGRVYYEADSERLMPAHFASPRAIQSLLEGMDDALFELIGETADSDFERATPEAREELRVLIEGWVAEHVNVTHYWRIVGQSRKCELTDEDVASVR